ncbi:hypothetical protein MSG28_012982 [Choristoneura fumiferana]|uniref:Uncharacterized protein n=1 Tax=Choristoneura fumiferana TaxID=7141 RepID=A0ACC0KRW0_CHOFU|nr:hypothetical protein MSG28_012982 [Choristoneura fumiferana]
MEPRRKEPESAARRSTPAHSMFTAKRASTDDTSRFASEFRRSEHPMAAILSKKIRKLSKKRNSITPQNKNCLEDVPKVIFRINPDIYPMRLTRSVQRMLDHRKDFIIVEIYRSFMHIS